MLKSTALDSAKSLLTVQGALPFSRLESLPLRMTKFINVDLGDSRDEESLQLRELKEIVQIADTWRKMPSVTKGRKSLEDFLNKSSEKQETHLLKNRMMVNHAGGIPENSGVAMHPLYGFPIIPGSALKGIARHHAWAEWQKMAREDGMDTGNLITLAETIARVFGFPTGDAKPRDAKKASDRPYLDDFIQEKLDKDKIGDHEGCIDFLMGIPANDEWHLVVDMLNPHGGNDYTEPVPTFFLAVAAGVDFLFYLKANSLASGDLKQSDLEFAARHLREGLYENGAGAKGAAGYGHFGLTSSELLQDPNRFNATLKLVTPAFLGGADWSKKDDTDLRVPSLRGMLRWWWRTLYREFLDDTELKKLEAAVWGDTERGSKILITCMAQQNVKVEAFDVKDERGFNLKPQFANEHRINPESRSNGLTYLSYGMCERRRETRNIRNYVLPGAEWTISFALRNNLSRIQWADGKALSGEEVIDQARMALSLLCRFGGIGSKSRKGFGSMVWQEAWTLDKCRKMAQKTIECLFPGRKLSNGPYSWTTAIITNDIAIKTQDPWNALDRLGIAVKGFANLHKHKPIKAVLGLPRKIHGPMPYPLGHQRQETHRPPENLKLNGIRGAQRLASPIWYHFSPSNDGFCLQIVAFPSDFARSMQESKNFLKEMLEHIKGNVANAVQTPSVKAPHNRNFGPASTAARTNLSGNVMVTMLEEKTKKGGWKAKSVELGVGAIQNSADVPPEVKPGEEHEVAIAVGTPGNAQYRWLKK